MAGIVVDRKLIERVARNARLELTKDEEAVFVKEFKDILDAFSAIDKAPASDIPSVHPEPVADVSRKDVVGKCLSQKDALANVAHKKDGFIKGPRVV